MLSPLRNRAYRHLFGAQVVALLGTGLATVALALLAYDLAGADAGVVLGTALAIKMVAYVGVAPVANAFADHLPRRGFLVAMDAVRAAVALLLPFVDEVWQIYILIFVLQSASAGFTPAFQATIPDVLPEEREYTRALSLSRLAYDLESLISPALAAALLSVISFHWLFTGTAVGFLASAALVLSTRLPQQRAAVRRSVYERTFRGSRIYLATPRLRGLMALNLSVSAAGAMVIVNTVVYVQAVLGRPEPQVAVALALYGGGSMLVALTLPRLLERADDRSVMVAGAGLLTLGMLAMAALSAGSPAGWTTLLTVWFLLGIGNAAVLTPAGRLLRRSSQPPDRPALFAAQFALSHACWLLTYPLAGWLGAEGGMALAFLALGGLSAAGCLLAPLLWPRDDPDVIEHVHADLPADDPHVSDARPIGRGLAHAHPFVIDDLHHQWPDNEERAWR